MSYTLAVGAVFRRETRWLREWIEFHRLQGVEQFYLFNHDQLEYRYHSDLVLEPYVRAGLVQNIHFDEITDFQMKANEGIIERAHADGVKWTAIIDIDEFLFSPKGRTLPQALESFDLPDVIGVAAWWRCYGSSDLSFAPMLQTEAFTMRAKDDDRCNHTHKFILRSDRLTGFVDRRNLGRIVDEHHETVVKGKRFGTVKRLRINHYAVRSRADWNLRVKRGLPPGGFRIDEKDLKNFYPDRWKLFEHNDIYDPMDPERLKALKEALHIEHE